jgi:outer membrane protein OmpA-like peptidoglycan-associated protein
MRKSMCLSLLLAGLFVLAAGIAGAQETDAEGTKDHPLLSRMPGFYISRAESKDFDSHDFYLEGDKKVEVEGKSTFIFYVLQPNGKEPSRLEILRQYENAIKKIGGTVLDHDRDGSSYMKVTQGEKEIWVHVDAYITSQVVADAAAFSNDIRTTGHAAVYGIFFDSGKSEIKPASDPALGEIAKLLKSDAALKLNVVGHTDNDGTLDINMRLSEARAAAVVQALVGKYGIAAGRLKAFGVGPLAPVAPNDAADGKAKNRRVELVKQ